ncbi:uncharacterized protein F4822DRAFT_440765 [Hypoxylon trugodes]|uniref:uncharacterized protein n=1 Tax=Hypoxylon trugodes TaxID=326681 RepID=UPI002191BC91|nr:uncharacterized protein F4822DRAFT_440765 [Hypoxylon trugodes]KAI1383077.1 hypothetical protein F4822DRAFT_440765 [Hypoxylon trugodes]
MYENRHGTEYPPVPQIAAAVLFKRRKKKEAASKKVANARRSSYALRGSPISCGVSAGDRQSLCTARFHSAPLGFKRQQYVGSQLQTVCEQCGKHWHKKITNTEGIQIEEVYQEPKVAQASMGIMNKNMAPISMNIHDAISQRNLSWPLPTLPGVIPEPLPSHCLPPEYQVTLPDDSADFQPPVPNYSRPYNRSMKKRKRVTRTNHQVAPEILSMILSNAMGSEPRCAFDLLLSDWSACKKSSSGPLMRSIIYTKGTISSASSLWETFEHHDKDHILLPTKTRDERLVMINQLCHNEVVKIFFRQSAQVFELGPDSLPDNIGEESFLDTWEEAFPIRGRRSRGILPFDDDDFRPPEKSAPFGTPHIYDLLRHIVIRSPLTLLDLDARGLVGPKAKIGYANLEVLDMAIDLDRASPLWVSWSQMPSLESVILDLRIYSNELNTERGCIGKHEIIERAQEMGRWLRLKLLVIAGLQSYMFETSYKSYTMEQIETEDELGSKPNWLKIFMPALRPGGKLVLLDRLNNE